MIRPCRAYGGFMRVAAFQREPIFDDSRAVSAVIAADVTWAASEGVNLAVFPEAYLDGHSYDRETVSARARPLHAPEVRELAKSLRGLPVTVIVGMFERRESAVRNVALVLQAGNIIGVYAKAHPNEDGVEAGVDMPIFETAGSRFAVNICNDANYPALAQQARRGGASMLCYPLNNVLPPATAEHWRERSIGNLVARARETRCWVISADVAGAYGNQVSLGCTAIVTPAGEIRARVPEGTTGRILLDLSPRPLAASEGQAR
jgi:predicted amidohydrolase